MNRNIALSLLLVLASTSFAQEDSLLDVRVEKDVVYGVARVKPLELIDRTKDKELLLDVYAPEPAVGRRPACVIVHGGGFRMGSKEKEQFTELAQYFAPRGIVCVSINYRLMGDNPDTAGDGDREQAAHAAFVDTKAAIRWLHANAEKYQVDTKRIAVLGGSAGAYSALTAAITDPDDYTTDKPGESIRPENHPEASSEVQLCVNLWGSADHILDEFDATDPPILTIHGTADERVPYQSALNIDAKCTEVGIAHKLVPLTAERHGPWRAEIHEVPIPEYVYGWLAEQFAAMDGE